MSLRRVSLDEQLCHSGLIVLVNSCVTVAFWLWLAFESLRGVSFDERLCHSGMTALVNSCFVMTG